MILCRSETNYTREKHVSVLLQGSSVITDKPVVYIGLLFGRSTDRRFIREFQFSPRCPIKSVCPSGRDIHVVRIVVIAAVPIFTEIFCFLFFVFCSRVYTSSRPLYMILAGVLLYLRDI